MFSFSRVALSLSLLVGGVFAFPSDGSDLTTFVSRPDIKAPKFNVKVHNEELVSPGYWFVGPYWLIRPEDATSRYMPCQIGPHIYDAEGTLIWTGACRFQNSNIFDFRTTEIDNKTYITFMHNNIPEVNEIEGKGYGMILDENYHERNTVLAPDYVNMFNMHEFHVINNGKSALSTLYKTRKMDFTPIGVRGEGHVVSGGLFEQDVETGEVIFQWDGYDYIPLNDSVKDWPRFLEGEPGWDYVHVNSADKTPDGDYLLSSRFTDTVFKISGQTGDIVWRLGGLRSDFEMVDFRFSRQHHVRHINSNATHMTISMLDNASDEMYSDGDPSAALFIQLDTSVSPMRATLLNRYNRPDGQLTRLRGSTQLLPDGNVFVGWSEQGYHSEFTPDGELVMEAKFTSDRFSSYRSFKCQWTGRPSHPPDVKAMTFGSTSSDLSTTIWVSWNGATDIASWNFYALSSASSTPVLIGNVRKHDFETMFMTTGYMGWVSAEALDADGEPIPVGKSAVFETITPGNWKASGFDAAEDTPDPMDPSVILQNKQEAEANKKTDSNVSPIELHGDFNQTEHSNLTSAQELPESDESFADAFSNAFQSKQALVTFCISLLVVFACAALLGAFLFFRSHFRRQSRSYQPVASEADGEDGRPVMTERNNI